MTTMLDGIQLFAVVITLLYVIIKSATSRRSQNRLPPGPKGYPLIGNAFDIPKGYDALGWAKFRELYGPISSVSALGNTIVVINDYNTAVDLLDKRSTIYSNRPPAVFAGDIVGWGKTTAMLQYNDTFKLSRKQMAHSIGSKNSVKSFHHILELETRRFLASALERPHELMNNVRIWAGASILNITYGYNIKREGEDPLIQIIDQAIREFSMAAQPGAWLVDMLPFIRHLPDWLPGTNFKRVGRQWNQTTQHTVGRPFAFVKAQMATGKAPESFTSQLLREPLTEEEEEVVKWSAEAVYGGGADTTVSTLYGFFLAMVLYPEVQKKAQAELDAVVGPDQLPTLEDRERLPYIDAVVKETLRWNTALPIGIPHVASEDSLNGEYFIPKGSLLIANLWLFNHDPKNFHDPMNFKPDRFLGVDGRAPELDPRNVTFGFGRRICPGNVFADQSLFIAIAMSLSVLDIQKQLDKSGQEITPPAKWVGDIVSHPAEFICQLKARSDKAKILIDSVHDQYPVPESDEKALPSLKW